ncbi:hypothetical protein [Nocardia fluminea]|uniref:hypothetical protein n=1 Tax=Nocardia fluminea TaxID=134984 RepID=UPI003D126A3B
MSLDWCRHCGGHEQMTVEHLPPRGTGNKSEVTLYREESGGGFTALAPFADGHALPTLCYQCNNGASERGLPQAYIAWHEDVVSQVQQYATGYHQVTGGSLDGFWSYKASDGSAKMLPLEHGRGADPDKMTNLHPGRIVRQVLGGFLAVQDNRRLLDDYPQLVKAYFADEPASIAPFSLHVALTDTGLTYQPAGSMMVTIDRRTGRSTSSDFWVLVFPPFLICLVRGDEAPTAATRIDHWFDQPVKATFSRQGRNVSYPIALRGDLLVEKLHRDRERLIADNPDLH